MKKEDIRQLFSVPVIVAALGYFVDIYDLLLFGIVRKPSLICFKCKWVVYWLEVSSGVYSAISAAGFPFYLVRF